MDNCRIHHCDGLREAVESAGFTLKFLPSSSPVLNPIEEVIADIKREIRRLLSTILLARILDIHALHCGQKTIARRALL
jgi:transposase